MTEQRGLGLQGCILASSWSWGQWDSGLAEGSSPFSSSLHKGTSLLKGKELKRRQRSGWGTPERLDITINLCFLMFFRTWVWTGISTLRAGKQSFALHLHEPRAGDAGFLADRGFKGRTLAQLT